MKIDRSISTRQQFLRIAPMLGVPIIVLSLSNTALAQIQPALPGSVEYTLTSNNGWWFEIPDPISIGDYVEDTLIDRNDQPTGRGIIGIVRNTGYDVGYDEWAATVDFGNDYSVGIVFSELTAVQIVPEPSTLLLLPGVLFWCAAIRRRRR